jgi:hypothetical protein
LPTGHIVIRSAANGISSEAGSSKGFVAERLHEFLAR